MRSLQDHDLCDRFLRYKTHERPEWGGRIITVYDSNSFLMGWETWHRVRHPIATRSLAVFSPRHVHHGLELLIEAMRRWWNIPDRPLCPQTEETELRILESIRRMITLLQLTPLWNPWSTNVAFITQHPQFLRFKGTEHAFLKDDFGDRSKYHGDYDLSEKKDFKAEKKYEAKQIEAKPYKKDFVGRRAIEAAKITEAKHKKKDFAAKKAIEAPETIVVMDRRKDFVGKRAIETPKTIEVKRPRKKEFKAPKHLNAPDPISAKGSKKEFKAAKFYEAKTIKMKERDRWSDDEGDEDNIYPDDSGSDSEPSKRKQRRKHGNRWSDDEAESTRKAYYSDDDSEPESDSGVKRSDCERGVNLSKNGINRLRIEYAHKRPGPSNRYATGSISSEEDSDPSNEETFDPYEALGVRKDDTTAFIDSIRKKLLTKYHPDKLGGKASERDATRAQQRTQEINRAWGILGDASRRKAYNKYGTIENNDRDEEMAVMRLSAKNKAALTAEPASKPRSKLKAQEKTEFLAKNVGTNKSARSENSKNDAEKRKKKGF